MKDNLIREEGSSVKSKDIYNKYKAFAEFEDLSKNEKFNKTELVNALKSAGCKLSFNEYNVQIIQDYRLTDEDSFLEN